MSGIQQLLAIIGIVLFGILSLAMLLMALFTEQTFFPLLMALVFLALAGFSGFQAFTNLRGRIDLSSMGEERSRILRFAASRNARLTAEEAALGCHLSVAQARALMDDMVINGSADTWVSDGGNLVYVFRGLLDEAEKASAEDPMGFLDA